MLHYSVLKGKVHKAKELRMHTTLRKLNDFRTENTKFSAIKVIITQGTRLGSLRALKQVFFMKCETRERHDE